MTEPISILIVDDHELSRRGVRDFLDTQPDLKVVGEASSGEEAVQLADETVPDIILLDLVIPGEMDGVTATLHTKKTSPRSQVVVLTAHHEDEGVYPAIRAGASAYILKDIRSEELADMVRQAARGEAGLNPRVAALLIREVRGGGDLTPNPFTNLSDREMEVLGLIADGRSPTKIAQELVISEKTVSGHISNILKKLHLGHRTRAIVSARGQGTASQDQTEG